MLRHRPFSYSALAVLLTAAPLAASPRPVSPGASERITMTDGPCPTFSWAPEPQAAAHELVVYELREAVQGSEPSERSLDPTPVLRQRIPDAASSWSPPLDLCLRRGASYAWSVRSLGEEAGVWSEARLFEVPDRVSPEEAEEARRVLERYLEEKASGPPTAGPGTETRRGAPTAPPSAPVADSMAAGAVETAVPTTPTESGVHAAVLGGAGSTINVGLQGVAQVDEEVKLEPEAIGVLGQASVAGANTYGNRSVGVRGESTSVRSGIGVEGRAEGPGSTGIHGFVSGTGPATAVRGDASGSTESWGGRFLSSGFGVFILAGSDTTPDLVLGGNSDIEGGNDGLIASEPGFSSSDLVLRSNDDVRIELEHDGAGTDEDADFEIYNNLGELIFDVDDQGAVTVDGVVVHSSDRKRKEGLEAVDPAALLEAVAQLPIYRWQFIGSEDGARHLGPTAQDFAAAFGLGSDDRYIATVDADGVALAAIQGLHRRLEELERENRELRERLGATP